MPPSGGRRRHAPENSAKNRFCARANFFDTCPDVQYAWEAEPTPRHDAVLSVRPFGIDRAPVSCARARFFFDISERADGELPRTRVDLKAC